MVQFSVLRSLKWCFCLLLETLLRPVYTVRVVGSGVATGDSIVFIPRKTPPPLSPLLLPNSITCTSPNKEDREPRTRNHSNPVRTFPEVSENTVGVSLTFVVIFVLRVAFFSRVSRAQFQSISPSVGCALRRSP